MAKVKIRSMRHRLPTTTNGPDILLNIYVNLCKTSKLLFEGILFSVFCFSGTVSQKIFNTQIWRVGLNKKVVRWKIQFLWEIVISNTASAKFTNDFLQKSWAKSFLKQTLIHSVKTRDLCSYLKKTLKMVKITGIFSCNLLLLLPENQSNIKLKILGNNCDISHL